MHDDSPPVPPQEGPFLLAQTLAQLQKALMEEFGSTVSIALSRPAEGYRQVSASYRQALEALQYRMVRGRGAILYADFLQEGRKRMTAYDSRFKKKIRIQWLRGNTARLANGPKELSYLDCRSIGIVLPAFFGKLKKIIYASNENRKSPLPMDEIDQLLNKKDVRFLDDLLQNLELLLDHLQSNREALPIDQSDAVAQARSIVEQNF